MEPAGSSAAPSCSGSTRPQARWPCGTPTATFIRGAYNGEIIVIIGKVTYVGRTSMEVRLDTYVEHLENGMRQPINRAYFTMVAMDENDQPRTVPRLILETESDRADWEAAEKRREMRMRRKEEGF